MPLTDFETRYANPPPYAGLNATEYLAYMRAVLGGQAYAHPRTDMKLAKAATSPATLSADAVRTMLSVGVLTDLSPRELQLLMPVMNALQDHAGTGFKNPSELVLPVEGVALSLRGVKPEAAQPSSTIPSGRGPAPSRER